MSNIIRPSFRSSEKRKAKALQQSLMEVQDQSFGFASNRSPYTFSPVHTSISQSVVERYLQHNNRKLSSPQRPPKSSNKAGATPLFASQCNAYPIAAADRIGSSRNNGLFGYSCKDDSSVASPLRLINGGGGLSNTMTQMKLIGTKEHLNNVKKQLRYANDSNVDEGEAHVQGMQEEPSAAKILSSSDVRYGTFDLQQSMSTEDDTVHDAYESDASLLDMQVNTSSPKILSSSSIDGCCGSSVQSTEDGTVHDDWIIEDMADEGSEECSSLAKGRTDEVDAFEAIYTDIIPGSNARDDLGKAK